MPIDFSSLKKVEGLPAFSQQPRHASNGLVRDGRVAVLVKLRQGEQRPSYLTPRAVFGPELFSAELDAEQLSRLDADPAIESIGPPKALPVIE
jgi:hypothetical protein